MSFNNIFKNSILFSNIVLNGCMFLFGLVILYTFFQILFSYREGVMIKAQLDKDSGKTYKASDRLVKKGRRAVGSTIKYPYAFWDLQYDKPTKKLKWVFKNWGGRKDKKKAKKYKFKKPTEAVGWVGAMTPAIASGGMKISKKWWKRKAKLRKEYTNLVIMAKKDQETVRRSKPKPKPPPKPPPKPKPIPKPKPVPLPPPKPKPPPPPKPKPVPIRRPKPKPKPRPPPRPRPPPPKPRPKPRPKPKPKPAVVRNYMKQLKVPKNCPQPVRQKNGWLDIFSGFGSPVNCEKRVIFKEGETETPEKYCAKNACYTSRNANDLYCNKDCQVGVIDVLVN